VCVSFGRTLEGRSQLLVRYVVCGTLLLGARGGVHGRGAVEPNSRGASDVLTGSHGAHLQASCLHCSITHRFCTIVPTGLPPYGHEESPDGRLRCPYAQGVWLDNPSYMMLQRLISACSNILSVYYAQNLGSDTLLSAEMCALDSQGISTPPLNIRVGEACIAAWLRRYAWYIGPVEVFWIRRLGGSVEVLELSRRSRQKGGKQRLDG
jgi:hypothetical protein